MKNTEGYWRDIQHPTKCSLVDNLPWPVENSISMEESRKFLEMLVVVEDKAHPIHYKGWSDCRICGKSVGSIEFEYKNWCWPGGLYHYINKHLVKPSDKFIKFIITESKTEKEHHRNKVYKNHQEQEL